MTDTDNTTLTGKVVVGFDGSAYAARALDAAIDEAMRRDTVLEIVFGWPWDRHSPTGHGIRDEAQRLYEASRNVTDRAAERARKRAPGLNVTPHLTSEAAAVALVRAGRTAALTVIGTRGHGGFTGLLLGSVSLRVAAHCTSPLLVLRGADRAPRGEVLVGVASDADTDAVRFGFEEARRRGAELRLLHAWQYPAAPVLPAPVAMPRGNLLQLRDSEESVPRFAASALRETYPDVEVREEAVLESPEWALLEATRDVDVVVVAAHRGTRALGRQLGPVTHALLHHAHCPVLLVPVQ